MTTNQPTRKIMNILDIKHILETDYMTQVEAIEYLSKTKQTLLVWEKTAKLNPIRIRNNVFYDKKELRKIKRQK